MELPVGQTSKKTRTNTVSHDYMSHSSVHYGFQQSGYQATLSESESCTFRMCETAVRELSPQLFTIRGVGLEPSVSPQQNNKV